MLSYTKGVHGVDKGGWTHKSYHHDFDCEGTCDLPSTPCYGKNKASKTFSPLIRIILFAEGDGPLDTATIVSFILYIAAFAIFD